MPTAPTTKTQHLGTPTGTPTGPAGPAGPQLTRPPWVPGPCPSDATPTVWVAVEGNISAGKTTAMDRLRTNKSALGPDVHFLCEPIDEWKSYRSGEDDLFGLFYADPARWAMVFQLVILRARENQVRSLRREIAERGRPALVIMERSTESFQEVFVRMAREAGHLHPIEAEFYGDAFRDSTARSCGSSPDHHIYCETPASTCYGRYIERDRDGERVTLEYLERCEEAHARWLDKKKNVTRLGPGASVEDWIRAIREIRAGKGASPPPIRLAFVGRARQGKTSAGNAIAEAVPGTTELSFAGPLKDIAAMITDVPRDRFETAEKDRPDPRLGGGTPREFLCALGKALRSLSSYYGPGGPLLCALNHELSRAGDRPVVVTDCRMEREGDFLRNKGFRVVRITGRPLDGAVPADVTETEGDGIPTDETIHNTGTLDDLRAAALRAARAAQGAQQKWE